MNMKTLNPMQLSSVNKPPMIPLNLILSSPVGPSPSDGRVRGRARFKACCVLGGMLLLLFHNDSLVAQESVRSVFEEKGVEWITGKWSGTNEQGRQVAVKYEWDLDGHLLEIDLRIGDMGYEGMIVRQPTNGRLIEFGADSTGGMTRSMWRVHDGALISERTGTRPDGQEVRVAVVTRKVNDDTIVATLHGLTEDGKPSDEILDTVKLKRQSTPQADD